MTQYINNFDCAKPFSDTTASFLLAATTEQHWTVPGTASQSYRAKFTFASNSNVWVGLNVTAAVPSTGGSTYNLEFRPDEPKFVKGGDKISLISSDAAGAQVGVALLMLPN